MVYIVGAGMGDAELITLRGLKYIRRAEVILYDHLIDPTLLSYASDNCILIYAGKTAGNHHMTQEEINSTLVKYGKDKTVVRLKGGDPFVFGRGSEEVEELVKNGISYELVPGVSSAYGAAEYAGIPVTHRGKAASFHVITGHEKGNGEMIDYAALSKLTGTLVFLMGLGNAPAIADNLIKNGKNGDTKTAIISNAGTEKQGAVTGTLKELPEMAKNVTSPAVIVIGDTVGCQNEWYRPSRKKILTTGTREINKNIKNAFGERAVTEIPLIKITEINYDKFTQTDLNSFSYIAFASGNGVNIFFDYLKRSGRDIRSLSDVRFAAVGKKTASVLYEKGIMTDIIPQSYNTAALCEALDNAGAKHVLFIRAENGTASNKYTDLPLYRTELDYSKKELLNLTAPDMDYIIFSSGSAARAYQEMVECKTAAKFISIGESTTKAAREAGIEIYRTAPYSSAEGIYETITGDESYD